LAVAIQFQATSCFWPTVPETGIIIRSLSKRLAHAQAFKPFSRFETFGVPGETAVDELGQSINPSIRSAGRRSKSRLENQ